MDPLETVRWSSLANMLLVWGGFMRGVATGRGRWKDFASVLSDGVSENDAIEGSETLGCAFTVVTASSTGTEGSRPLVYEAVNSHDSPDFRHNIHGQRPVHLVFFLRKGHYMSIDASEEHNSW